MIKKLFELLWLSFLYLIIIGLMVGLIALAFRLLGVTHVGLYELTLSLALLKLSHCMYEILIDQIRGGLNDS